MAKRPKLWWCTRCMRPADRQATSDERHVDPIAGGDGCGGMLVGYQEYLDTLPNIERAIDSIWNRSHDHPLECGASSEEGRDTRDAP